jgi:hypothetical protein
LRRLEYLRRTDCGEKLKVHWYVALRCIALQLLAENANTRRDRARRGEGHRHPSVLRKRPSASEITLTSAKAWQARVDKQCSAKIASRRPSGGGRMRRPDRQIDNIPTSESPHFLTSSLPHFLTSSLPKWLVEQAPHRPAL